MASLHLLEGGFFFVAYLGLVTKHHSIQSTKFGMIIVFNVTDLL